MLPLLAVTLLSAVEAPAAAPTSAPAPSFFSDEDRPALALVGGTAVTLGVASAVLSWADQDGTGGRVAAITAGTLATGLLAASVCALIGWRLVLHQQPRDVGDLVVQTFSAVSVVIASLIAGLVGLGVGAVISVFATAPAGPPRGAYGVVSGSVLAATSLLAVAFAW